MDATALRRLSRKEIQKLAQCNGIRANMKSEAIIAQLVLKYPDGVPELLSPSPQILVQVKREHEGDTMHTVPAQHHTRSQGPSPQYRKITSHTARYSGAAEAVAGPSRLTSGELCELACIGSLSRTEEWIDSNRRSRRSPAKASERGEEKMADPYTYIHGSPTPLRRDRPVSHRKAARNSILLPIHALEGEAATEGRLTGIDNSIVSSRRKPGYPPTLAPKYMADIFTESAPASNALGLTFGHSYPPAAGLSLNSKKRKCADEDNIDEPPKATKRTCLDLPEERTLCFTGPQFPDWRTPTPGPAFEGITEARAKLILQGLTKKSNGINKLMNEIADVQQLLQIITTRNKRGHEKLKELRMHRKVMERHYIMVLKGDGRLHDGSCSWTEHSDARPTFVRAISEEVDTSEYVETDDEEEPEGGDVYVGIEIS